MVAINNHDTQPTEFPECLVLDSQSGELHPDMGSLFQNLSKAQGDTLGKLVTGLRGYIVNGFSFQVYARPESAASNTAYSLRVQLEYDATVKSGANYERVRAAYMDALKSGESPTVESPRVAKPGK